MFHVIRPKATCHFYLKITFFFWFQLTAILLFHSLSLSLSWKTHKNRKLVCCIKTKYANLYHDRIWILTVLLAVYNRWYKNAFLFDRFMRISFEYGEQACDSLFDKGCGLWVQEMVTGLSQFLYYWWPEDQQPKRWQEDHYRVALPHPLGERYYGIKGL